MPRSALAPSFVLLLALSLLGCQVFTDPLGRRDALEESQKKYTDLIRWGEITAAASYVEPDLREDFLELVPVFENIRITDYELGEIELDGKQSAELVVTYRGYLMPHFIEKTVVEKQSWKREKGNTWRVTPEIAGLIDGLAGTAQ
jgi:hypothetical protein